MVIILIVKFDAFYNLGIIILTSELYISNQLFRKLSYNVLSRYFIRNNSSFVVSL